MKDGRTRLELGRVPCHPRASKAGHLVRPGAHCGVLQPSGEGLSWLKIGSSMLECASGRSGSDAVRLGVRLWESHAAS